LRTIIRNLIANIEPFNDKEKFHQADILTWIDSGAEIFRIEKHNVPDRHLAAFGAVIDPDASEILLCDHKNAGGWVPTGGHVDYNEDPRQTVLRETVEELGFHAPLLFDEPVYIDQQTHNLPERGIMHTDVTFWFALKGDVRTPITFDKNEFYGVGWFPLDSLPENLPNENLMDFIAKLRLKLGKA
jgi:ADP-ribose pyrophosphatase YjhB (NUDIX family)